MKQHDLAPEVVSGAEHGEDRLSRLLRGTAERLAVAPVPDPVRWPSLIVGELLALTEGGALAWVRFPRQPGAGAQPARTAVDLFRHQIGQPVLLAFENGEALKPIVMGALRGATLGPAAHRDGVVDVDVDGDRLSIEARRELVLRCGKSSILLRADGRIELRGEDVTTHATGANRIRGGSVQLN